MKFAIFYFTKQDGRRPTLVPDDENISPVYCDEIRIGLIRVETVEAADSIEALDMATPLSSESVMNAHEI